jgi:hypothetical protein
MHDSLATIRCVQPLADATALDRWEGMRRFGSSGGGSGWFWLVLAVLAGAAIAGTIVAIVRRHRKTRRQWAEFQQRGRKVGLRREEMGLLERAVRRSGLKRPTSIYTSNRTFDRIAARLVRTADAAAGIGPKGKALEAMLESIRAKMGFERTDVREEFSLRSSRDIPAGVHLLVQRAGSEDPVDAVLQGNRDADLIVELETEVDSGPGEKWTLRYFHELSAWEFDVATIQSEGHKVHLTHSRDVRRINLRRFPRVETDKPAFSAAFPFHGEASDIEDLDFVSAKLIEIAGPGMVFRADLDVRLGGRLLVTVKLDNDRLVQGMAKVRRVFSDENDHRLVAVEMMGLNPDELAELVRQTYVAMAVHRDQADEAERVPVGSGEETRE